MTSPDDDQLIERLRRYRRSSTPLSATPARWVQAIGTPVPARTF